jgi:predicted ATPase
MRLTEPLNVAIYEGLVSKQGGKYYFCHDRLQEAAYSMIDERHRCQQHMNHGLALINLSLMDLSSGTENLFFTAVTQLNLGGPTAVQGNADQYYLISSYNLMAGKKAMQISDFSSAFAFFDQGILFLREEHWQDQYILSLELFNLAAKCALTIKKLTRLDIICHQLLRNARSFEDTLNISFISASALAYSKIHDSVQCCLTVLSQLGIGIPDSASRDDTLNLIYQTQSMLSIIADDSLLNYRLMTDFKKVMAMKFLAKLELSVLQTNPALQPFVTIKMCQLSIDHGLSPMSAIGFAYFGGMVAELGDVRGGHRYTKLAKTLLDKFPSNEFAGEVIWLSTEILHYIEPYQTANEYRVEGQRTAIAAGDVHWACMHKLLYSSSLPHLGISLSVTKEAMVNARSVRFSHFLALICLF